MEIFKAFLEMPLFVKCGYRFFLFPDFFWTRRHWNDGFSAIRPGRTALRILFLHIVTTLTAFDALFVACYRGRGTYEATARPSWNFLIRQIRIRLFADATAASSLGALCRDNGSKDHTTIGCTVFPLDPGCRARLPGARQSDENGSSDGDVGIERIGEGHERESCVSLTFLDSSVHFFLDFCTRKLDCRVYLLQGTRWKKRWKKRRKKKRKASTLSALMLRVEGDGNCPANASQYLE